MPTGILEKVIARLEEMGHKVARYGNEYRSQCPAHHGRNMSFAFSEGDGGRLLATCHSKKCSFEEIAKALNLSPTETIGSAAVLGPPSPVPKKTGPRGKTVHPTLKAATLAAAFGINSNFRREPNVIFQYHNSDGTENLFACRWELTPDEQQHLQINDHKQIRYVSAFESGYIVGTVPGRLYPVYKIDELAKLISRTKDSVVRIHLCEGEKATEKAVSLGLTATCTPFGSESAAKADWQTLDRLATQYKKTLELIILPDNDEAGQLYAQNLLAIFQSFESKPIVKIISFADQTSLTGIKEFPVKGDICELCDLLDSKSNDDIAGLIRQMALESKPVEDLPILESIPVKELQFVSDAEVEQRDVTFAWNNWLPYGKVILINGMGSAGKTSLICSFMATITAGSLWPDGQKAEQGCVIYFTSEDGIQDTISRRFRAHGGYSPKMFYYQQVHNNIDKTDEDFVLQEIKLLEQMVEKIEKEHGPVRMIVFDPITAFTGKIDENKNNQVRSILGPLMRLTEGKDFVFIGIIHPKKGAMFSGTAAEGVAGSSGYVNTVRRVYQVFNDKENAIRYMLVAKNNLGKDPTGLAFVINDGIVSFTDTNVQMDADDYIARQREKFLKPGRSKRSNIDDVEEWLTDFLSGGSMPSGQYDSNDETTIFGAGKKKGFSKNSIYQAKKNLGIKAFKGQGDKNDTWYWSLPVDEELTNEFQNDFKMYAAGEY